MKTGILGGTFDPIHLGHLSIALAARDELGLDEVLLMPAKVSPFKQSKKHAPDSDRIRMAELAAEDLSRVRVSRWEIERNEVSYTYNTLDTLEREHPEIQFVFLMGTDSFLELETWYHGEELLRRFSFALAPRPGFQRSEYEKKLDRYRDQYGAKVSVLRNEMIPVSSTDIRMRVKQGKSLRGLVPESVEQYIYEHRLYQEIS